MFILSQLSGISHHYKQKYTTGKKKEERIFFSKNNIASTGIYRYEITYTFYSY